MKLRLSASVLLLGCIFQYSPSNKAPSANWKQRQCFWKASSSEAALFLPGMLVWPTVWQLCEQGRVTRWVLLSEKLDLAPIVLHHLIASCEDLSVCNIYLFFSFIFGPHHVACGILVPRPGIRVVHPAVEVWSPNHWTTRKTPVISTFCVVAIPGRVGTSQIITWIFTLVLKAGGMVSFA